MSEMGFRGWLSKGRPEKLRIKTADGEERVIAIAKGKRMNLDALMATLKTAGATTVEKLGANDVILGARNFNEEDVEDENFEAEAAPGQAGLSKAMREQAAMLDAYGRRMNEAFARGAEAASTSQDKLVQLVETLTQHLTLAITNLHNISTNYANVVASAAGDNENGNGAQALLGLVAAMTGKLPAGPPAPANGKKGA